jgi:L-ascorbate metabolism protein UlaG (beta-lactamase superfamily)
MTITHLGHACLLYESGSARVLIDPGTLSSFSDLTDLTAVLVTHEHADHVDVPSVTALLSANPSALLVCDERTAASFGSARVAGPGDVLELGEVTVAVLGGTHAPVYGDVPDCPNLAYLLDAGALFHPGDSFTLPPSSVQTLAVPIDGPWLKLSEAVDYVKAVRPQTVLPIHEGELTDVAKYVGMLAAFSAEG